MIWLLLLSLIAARPASADAFWQNLTWNTPDGVKMVGLYHPAERSGAFTWVLLHGLGSTKEEWNGFSRQLAKQGDGILIYDARGHNESTKKADGTVISYQDWHTGGAGSPWAAMPEDLALAIGQIERLSNISEAAIAVGGASLGANVALIYAANHPMVPALLMLSPGLEYAGIPTPKAFIAYKGRPVLIAASPTDNYAYSSVRELVARAPSLETLFLAGHAGHGVQMFDETFTKSVLDWMRSLDGNRNRRPS